MLKRAVAALLLAGNKAVAVLLWVGDKAVDALWCAGHKAVDVLLWVGKNRVTALLWSMWLLVTASVVGGLGVTFYAGASTYGAPGAPRLAGVQLTVSAAPFAQTTNTNCTIDYTPTTQLVLVVRHFDPQSGAVTVQPWFCMSPQVLNWLVQTLAKQDHDVVHVPIPPMLYSGRLPRAVGDTRIGLSYTTAPGQTPVNPAVLWQSTTLRTLVSGGGRFVPLGQMTFPGTLETSRYPFDWYATQGSLIFTTGDYPGPSVVPTTIGGEDVKHSIGVLRDADIAPLTLKAAVQSDGLILVLERPGRIRLFVIATAAIPLLLTCLLLIVLVGSWRETPIRRREKPNRIGIEILVGVAAILLAVLPIRAVLVPAGFVGVTLVDYGLGFEMAFLAFVVCLAARSILWESRPLFSRGRRQPARQDSKVWPQR
jgi:hypothetical protein